MKCENCESGHFLIDTVKNFIVEVKCAECGFIFQSVRDLYDSGLKGAADYPPLKRFELWVTRSGFK